MTARDQPRRQDHKRHLQDKKDYLQKYLQHYAEPEARTLSQYLIAPHWQQVLVIPAYRESPIFLQHLPRSADTLLILVLNRPDSEHDITCNDELRRHLLMRPTVQILPDANATLLALTGNTDVLLIERTAPLPHKQGVGLARKIGCDVALALHATNHISSRWIHCSDADATLPADYFEAATGAVTAVALSYRFSHTLPRESRERCAMQVYERYLEHYVLGLEKAGSPYAFHTLGSCIAVDATSYAKVRGFPRRAGGEDFYLLNKLAKHGTVVTPDCNPIRLAARLSRRVPFGTGPALLKLLNEKHPEHARMFYHPQCFETLGVLISDMVQHGRPGLRIGDLSARFTRSPQINAALAGLGIEKFLLHADRQCATPEAFTRQFHQWFDGFRTLKFIHALSEHYGRVTLDSLGTPA